jgi:hypothetical protein
MALHEAAIGAVVVMETLYIYIIHSVVFYETRMSIYLDMYLQKCDFVLLDVSQLTYRHPKSVKAHDE